VPELSTSIGLLLKGFEQVETIKRLRGSENEFEEVETPQTETQIKREVKKVGMIESFKRKFTAIFEENDAEM